MLKILCSLFFILSFVFSKDLQNNNSKLDSNTDSIEENDSKKYLDYEFPVYEDKDKLNNLISRFSIYDETYLLPLYFSISELPSPPGAKAKYSKFESKLQVSFKTLVTKDMFAGIGFYFAYTQTTFFQIYSPQLSSPFRDNDFTPELILYRTFYVDSTIPSIYNLRFGYSHTSNGEGVDEFGFKKSRGMDRVFLELDYSIENFTAALKTWIFARFDPFDIRDYIGYSSLKLKYDLFNTHHFILSIGNLFHNYAKYKGNVRFEYRYDFDKFGIYAQYFYGYNDNIYQYNIKTEHIGIGIAIAH